ncbi:hypothetical protein O6H91_17G073500 [Diphasiastrum complanatum]|uniref:Uncharacterized protein n=2 Tax=Diphasiastrum complanatum TaxID=34168 RepID=A0ACC2B883_DIPCM|nr:hypothetical protein O6H91_17G073200 [Diphasiastrum complanatum]KAJ7525909.1 hypothetical protein O6H91_17G073500 [Diphasiastrum complanatum]
MQTLLSESPAPVSIEWAAPPQLQIQPKSHTPNYGRSSDTTANAVSFGFIATAILISIFLVIAIFERLLRPRPPLTAVSLQNSHSELSGMPGRNSRIGKPDEPSSEVDYTKGVSVLMPGQVIPTYIARPVPYADLPEASHQSFQEHEISSDSRLASCHIDVKAENSETQSAH